MWDGATRGNPSRASLKHEGDPMQHLPTSRDQSGPAPEPSQPQPTRPHRRTLARARHRLPSPPHGDRSAVDPISPSANGEARRCDDRLKSGSAEAYNCGAPLRSARGRPPLITAPTDGPSPPVASMLIVYRKPCTRRSEAAATGPKLDGGRRAPERLRHRHYLGRVIRPNFVNCWSERLLCRSDRLHLDTADKLIRRDKGI